MAAKDAHGLVSWWEWEPELALREPGALEQARERLRNDIECNKFIQFEFERQWCELKAHCARNEIRIVGDIPIYVALDSADVWTNRELLSLRRRTPSEIAGVPPDYFSATGQLWGNPIYRWEPAKETGYVGGLNASVAHWTLYDAVRIDHFRGFEAYWEIPGSETTAVNGRWVKGPAWRCLLPRRRFGDLPIVAENLGVITPEVEAIRERFGFPGMAMLQFAFGNDPQAPFPSSQLSANSRPTPAPTTTTPRSDGGTVPEQTAFVTEADVEKEMTYAKRYLNTDGHDINLVMIRTLMASVADTVLFPLQDVLGVGSEGRMNLPGTSSGNWRWRFRQEQLNTRISAPVKVGEPKMYSETWKEAVLRRASDRCIRATTRGGHAVAVMCAWFRSLLDLLAAALEHRFEVRRAIVALEQRLRFVGPRGRARAADLRGSGACRR